MKENKKRTPKQFAALLCVIILICMYLITFVVACLDFPGSDKLFSACLLTTIGLPILLWIYIWLYGKTKERLSQSASSVSADEADESDEDIQ